MKKDYYEILGIDQDATNDEIKKAYKKLAFEFHPDRNTNNKEAEEKFKEVVEAYETLSAPEKRQMYDMGGDPFASAGMNPNEHINDILKSMGFNINFGFAGAGQQQHRMQIRHQINVSLKDAVFGCDVDIEAPSYVTCKQCNGDGGTKVKCHKCNGNGQTMASFGTMQYYSTCVTCNGAGFVLTSTCSACNREGMNKKTRNLKLKIPPGVQNQVALRIPPEADEKSEIIVIVNVLQHPKFTRNGANIFSTELISCLDALVGGSKMVETLDGIVKLDIPPGAQHGQQLVIENRGGLLSNGRANHIVNVHIEVPKNLTKEQLEQIKQIRDGLKN